MADIEIKTEVKNIHSYDIPCIIKIKAEANSAYRQWIEESTS